MFDDFREQTKETFFDELDEKFRDFSQDLEKRNTIDLTKFIKRIDDLEVWKASQLTKLLELESKVANDYQERVELRISKVHNEL